MTEVATADLLNFAAMASPVNRVVVDDTPCAVTWCVGPSVAWQNGVTQQKVKPVRSQPMGTYRGFVVGEFLHPEAAPEVAATSPVPMLESTALVELIFKAEAAHAEPLFVVNLGAG